VSEPIVYLDVYPADSQQTIEYGLWIASFSAATPACGWDPGDCGEIDLDPFVTVLVDGREVGVTTLDTALREYAASERITLDKARQVAEDKAYEAACERAAEADEDARARWAEDRAEAGRFW
jgi:hypothetical protein